MPPAASPEDVVVLSSSMSGGGGISAGEEEVSAAAAAAAKSTGNGNSERGKKQQSREAADDNNGEEAKKKKKPKRKVEGRNVPAGSMVADASCSFPMSRVWRLVRSEGSNNTAATATRTTPDAIFLINKASEMFLELFAEDAFSSAKKRRKKDVSYDSLASAVHDVKRYEFLSDFVPEKLRAEDALKARESVET